MKLGILKTSVLLGGLIVMTQAAHADLCSGFSWEGLQGDPSWNQVMASVGCHDQVNDGGGRDGLAFGINNVVFAWGLDGNANINPDGSFAPGQGLQWLTSAPQPQAQPAQQADDFCYGDLTGDDNDFDPSDPDCKGHANSTISFDEVVTCPLNQETQNGVCVCVSGTEWNGRTCAALAAMPAAHPLVEYNVDPVAHLIYGSPYVSVQYPAGGPCSDPNKFVNEQGQCEYPEILMGTISPIGIGSNMANLMKVAERNGTDWAHLVRLANGPAGQEVRQTILRNAQRAGDVIVRWDERSALLRQVGGNDTLLDMLIKFVLYTN